MAGGQSSAPAPGLVAVDFDLELAAILHPRMVALIVLANRLKHATQKAVVHVRICRLGTRLVGIGIFVE